jgi:hypothetical protein
MGVGLLSLRWESLLRQVGHAKQAPAINSRQEEREGLCYHLWEVPGTLVKPRDLV